jgi:hypothetical protein
VQVIGRVPPFGSDGIVSRESCHSRIGGLNGSTLDRDTRSEEPRDNEALRIGRSMTVRCEGVVSAQAAPFTRGRTPPRSSRRMTLPPPVVEVDEGKHPDEGHLISSVWPRGLSWGYDLKLNQPPGFK